MKRLFQSDVGSAIQMGTLSFSGGCLVIAVTRQTLELFGSTPADSMLVFDSASMQDRTAFGFGTVGFCLMLKGGAAPREQADGAPFAAPPLVPPCAPGCCVPFCWARLCVSARTIGGAVAMVLLAKIFRIAPLAPGFCIRGLLYRNIARSPTRSLYR